MLDFLEDEQQPLQSRYCHTKWRILKRFQFPSNGKTYTKGYRPEQKAGCFLVSIPFKRENIYKESMGPYERRDYIERFNSLQTGKHIQSPCSPLKSPQAFGKRFNSLQTGKHIQRLRIRVYQPVSPFLVSIPFKRESIYKVVPAGKWYWDGEPVFQFPSNGKAYTKPLRSGTAARNSWTSFNSLQTGKHIQRVRGKDYEIEDRKRFNSLQTGTRIASQTTICFCMKARWFQFPSNGNAYRK